jgi:DNA-binding NarL/FixJ family response regulator
MSIRVAIADDQSLVRDGFRVQLGLAPDIEYVGEAADGQQAVALARREHPDVLLMDVRMPGTDGIEATRRITGDPTLSGVRVLVLTTFELDEYVLAALSAGASGFLLKDVRREDLVHAVRVVAAGEALLAPSITRRLIGQFAKRLTVDAVVSRRLDRLTDREREVCARSPGGRAMPRSPRSCSSGQRPSSRTCPASSPRSACVTAPRS